MKFILQTISCNNQSIETERKTELSGPKSQMSGGAVSGSRKNEQCGAEGGARGRGAVSGLNLPIMADKAFCPFYILCTLYSAVFSSLV